MSTVSSGVSSLPFLYTDRMVTHRAAQRRARIAGTVGLAAVHLYLAAIGLFGRLNYTVPSEYKLIHEAASTSIWVPLHFVLGSALIVALLSGQPRMVRIACHLSVAILSTWTFFNLLWGITTISPVSLAIPGLAASVTLGAHILAGVWMRQEPTR